VCPLRGEGRLRHVKSWCGAPKRESVARREACGASMGVRGTPKGVRGFNGSPRYAGRRAGLQWESAVRRKACGASTGVRGTSKGVWGSETGVRGTSKGVCGTWKTGARRPGGASKTEAGGALNKRAPCFESRQWWCAERRAGTAGAVLTPVGHESGGVAPHPGEVQCLSQGAGRAGESASPKSAVLLTNKILPVRSRLSDWFTGATR